MPNPRILDSQRSILPTARLEELKARLDAIVDDIDALLAKAASARTQAEEDGLRAGLAGLIRI